MRPLRRARDLPAPQWSRQKMLALLALAALIVVVLVVGLVLAAVLALSPTRPGTAAGVAADVTSSASADAPNGPNVTADARDLLAAEPMPLVPESASRPGPVSTTDPGPPVVLPPATEVGPAAVPTGFPRTPEGAMAQLAAINQAALQSGLMSGVRDVIAAWAMPGGPTTTSWSGVRAMSTLLDATGLSGGASSQLVVVLTPHMGIIKGGVGPDFVVPCVDFVIEVTLQQTARAAVADCQRMVWHSGRWVIGPGEEPATPPSVWPGTDVAISVGYRDLRRG